MDTRKKIACRPVGYLNKKNRLTAIASLKTLSQHLNLHTVLLAFGSNLGARHETLRQAWQALAQLPDVETCQLSRFYETKPVGGPSGQANYINAAGLIQTTLTPEALLEVIHQVESQFGRVRTERWGSRTLDIDILLYDQLIFKTRTLVIPHPRMLERLFVLEPAIEIAPEMIHPEAGLPLETFLPSMKMLRAGA